MILTTNDIEFILLVLGFGLGILPRMSLLFRIGIFTLQVLDWWIKTHPKGQQLSQETGLDEEFYRLFKPEIERHPHLFNASFRKKPGRKFGFRLKVDKGEKEVI